MKTFRAATFFLLVSVSIQAWADANSDALKKLALIPDAPIIVTMDQASGCPSVSLTDKGALINKSETPVPFDQVLAALSALPKSAWGFGRLVVIRVSPPADSKALPAAKADVDKVVSDLQKANIRLLHAD